MPLTRSAFAGQGMQGVKVLHRGSVLLKGRQLNFQRRVLADATLDLYNVRSTPVSKCAMVKEARTQGRLGKECS